MIKFVINKYSNHIHSTTNHTPNDAHQDKNSVGVAVNLAMKSVHKRKYKNINVGDDVQTFTKGKGNYTSRKETTSRWSERFYKVEKIDREITLHTYYILEGLPNRRFNRHELLLLD